MGKKSIGGTYEGAKPLANYRSGGNGALYNTAYFIVVQASGPSATCECSSLLQGLGKV